MKTFVLVLTIWLHDGNSHEMVVDHGLTFLDCWQGVMFYDSFKTDLLMAGCRVE